MFEIKLLKEHVELCDGLVWLPIMGKLKEDDNSGVYYLRSVPITSSGVNVKQWQDLLLAVHQKAGRLAGPAICDSKGVLLESKQMNGWLWEALEYLYNKPQTKKLFPAAVSSRELIRVLVQLSRFPRRSGELRAVSKGVLEDDSLIICWYSKRQSAKGASPNEPLRLSYADQTQLDECFKHFTSTV